MCVCVHSCGCVHIACVFAWVLACLCECMRACVRACVVVGVGVWVSGWGEGGWTLSCKPLLCTSDNIMDKQ